MRKIISFLFILAMGSNSFAESGEGFRRDLYFGLGSSFGSQFSTVHVHSQLGFTFYEKNRFSLQAGPHLQLGSSFKGILVLADIDAFLTAKYQIASTDPSLNLYAKLPLGYSLVLEGGGGAALIGHGFNFGLVPGLEIQWTPNWGLYIEAGYLARSFNNISHGGVFNIGAKYSF